MASYTYRFHDLLTNAHLADLPLAGVSYSDVLGEVGEFTGELRGLGTAAVRQLDPLQATEPGKVAVYVDRDGSLMWGGIVWGRRGTARGLQVRAEGFRSYYRRRRIRWNLTYSGTDQLAILCDILDRCAQEASGDIGLVLPDPAQQVSGVTRDRTYYGNERKQVEEAWTDLEQVQEGFESAVRVAYDANGEPAKYLVLGYPQLGANAGVVFEKDENGGNLLDHGGWPEDASATAFRVTAIGATVQLAGGDEGPPLMAEAWDQLAGYPLLEEVTSYTDVRRWLTLAGHAAYDLAQLSTVVSAPELTVDASDGSAFPLGTFAAGDTVRVRVTDSRFPRLAGGGPGLDTSLRTLGVTVGVGEGGREDVKVAVGETTLLRRDQYQRTRQLLRRLLKLEARQPPDPAA